VGEIIILTMKISISNPTVNYKRLLCVIFFLILILFSNPVHSQETIDVGKTGWEVKRPVMAAACESGCPWGELGDFIKESMKPC
jgi:hypothetical protein